MQIQPYISFNKNHQEAAEFYADIFRTDQPEIMLFGEMSLNSNFSSSEESKMRSRYKSAKFHETKITLSDIPPKSPQVKGDKITLVIFSDDLEEIKVLYYKLKNGGKVQMPLQETAWSKAYASVIDQYGVEWQLNLEDELMT